MFYYYQTHDGRKRREKERYESLIVKLKDEEKKQEEHHCRIRARMKHERDNWFFASKQLLVVVCRRCFCCFLEIMLE